MADLTPTEAFVVRRLKQKFGAAMHHLGDARTAAASLSPEVMADCGFRQRLALLESKVNELRAIVHGLPFAEKAVGDG